MTLKVLLVTSRVTLVPDNYLGFLQGTLTHAGALVAGLVLLDNVKPPLFLQAAGLLAAQAFQLGTTLVANMAATFPKSRDPRALLFRQKNLPVVFTNNMSAPVILDFIAKNKIDVVINARTRDIYRAATLAAPRLGCLNIHHGLLPEERGVNCDLFALAENRPAGFSIHVMTPKIDDGRILLREEVPYEKTKNYLALQQRSSLAEAEALANVLHQIDKLGKLPEGRPNSAADIKFRRVKPTLETIRMFKNQGVKL